MTQALRENKSDILSQEKMDIRKAGSYEGTWQRVPGSFLNPGCLQRPGKDRTAGDRKLGYSPGRRNQGSGHGRAVK